MSRIIVKQLPKNVTEEQLRKLFGSKGTITDMQLKYTPDGHFRQFCFIGYRSEDEAQTAIKFFHNSCIQTSRLKVELCAALGNEDKPQSWSKYAKDSKKGMEAADGGIGKEKNAKDSEKTKEKKKKISKFDEIIGGHKDDPEFQEFMKAHDRNRQLWDNDAAMATVEDNEETDEKAVNNDVQEESNKGGGNSKNYDNDDEEQEQSEPEIEEEEAKLAQKPISDLDYMKSLMSQSTATASKTEAKNADKAKKPKEGLDLYTIKIHNVPYKTKRQEILKFFKPLKPYSVRLPTNVHGFCYVGFKTEKDMVKGMLKNKSFIKGKQVFFSDFTEKNKISKNGRNESSAGGELTKATNPKWLKQTESLRNEENISESGCIFFRNLAYTVTDDDLQQVFEQFGPVAEINLPVDTITRQIKGFGTVTFVMPEHAMLAFNKLDGTDFHGRLLHLIPGKSKDDKDEAADVEDAALSFKQKKALKLKKSAQQSISWNTLFLGPNAVAEILAKKFETSKEKILDTNDGGSSAAVRIALGETQIVIEMKKFLEEHGVSLSAFDALATTKRSKTIILTKNLPAETSIAELTPIFSKFGPIGRIVLPPSGVTALIEYCDSSEARQAFKKLAYSKFKNAPLYLEWAPENVFKTTLSGEPIIPKEEEIKEETNKENKTASAAPQTQIDAEENNETTTAADGNAEDDDDVSDEPPEPNTTLFLRNLNFKTVLETVRNHFKRLGAIHTVEVAKRKDAENPRQLVSLGYGFIQFKKAETAEQALKRMQFTTIDGNQVELKRSDRTLKSPHDNTQRKPVAATKQTGTKIMVRNIPFQAKSNEVRDIFKAFGELRTLRLPMKMTPGEATHRGFGFVDFVTKSDAKKAFEALSQSTHLYGRRLVLEWAATGEEDVTELRKRTAEHFNIGSGNRGSAAKQSNKSIFDADGSATAAAGDEEAD